MFSKILFTKIVFSWCAIVFSLLLFPNFSNAQNCTPESLLQKPGAWKVGMPGSPSKSPISAIAIAKKVTDGIHQLISKNYDPKGLQAIYASTKPDPASGKMYEVSPYYYAIYFMRYYCDKGVQKTAHETSSTLKIHTNYQNIFYTHNVIESFIGENFEKENYGWLTTRPVLENGTWYMGASETKNSFGQKLRTTNWIVAYDNVAPFLFVTRKEYLEKLKVKLALAKLYDEKTLRGSNLVRPMAEQEADKNRIVAANSTTEAGRKWVNNKFLPEYRTDEQRLEQDIAKNNARHDLKMAFVEKLLNMPASDLQQDAIVSAVSEFEGFVPEDDRYKRYIIKENPNYYNKKLPSASAQLFGIEFIVETEDVILMQAYNGVMNAFDLKALQNLLGK